MSRSKKTEKYPEFGFVLFESIYYVLHGTKVSRRAKPRTWDRAANHLKQAIEEVSGVAITYSNSVIRSWMVEGEVITENSSLSYNNFKAILEHLISNDVPWLKTQQDIAQWVKLGRRKYQDVLWEDFVVALPENPLSDYWKPSTYIPALPIPFYEREQYEDVYQKIGVLKKKGLPLVLYGPSGHGKTVLLRWLRSKKVLTSQFDRIIWVSGGEDERLIDWLQSIQILLSGRTETMPTTVAVAMAHIRVLAEEHKILFLLDNCYVPRLVDRMQELLMAGDFAIITTRANTGVAERASVISRYAVPPFNRELLQFFAEKYNAEQPSKTAIENLMAVFHELNENMHAMAPALARTASQGWDWEDTLARLQSLPVNDPGEIENETYRALCLAYQEMPSELQEAFRAIGALPALGQYDLGVFESLWEVSAEQAAQWLSQLDMAMDILEDSSYRLRDRVIPFAHHLLDKKEGPREQRNASKWIQRYTQTPSIQREYHRLAQEGLHRSIFRTFRDVKTRPISKDVYGRSGGGKLVNAIKALSPLRDSTEWQYAQRILSSLSSKDYAFGYLVNRRNKRLVLLFWLTLFIIFSAQIITARSESVLAGILNLILIILALFLFARMRTKYEKRAQSIWLHTWEQYEEQEK
jgi:hypothetical protein